MQEVPDKGSKAGPCTTSHITSTKALFCLFFIMSGPKALFCLFFIMTGTKALFCLFFYHVRPCADVGVPVPDRGFVSPPNESRSAHRNLIWAGCVQSVETNNSERITMF